MTLYAYLESALKESPVFEHGGAGAMPAPFVELFRTKYGVRFMLAWGMTEIAPIGTVTALKSELECAAGSDASSMARHGIAVAGVDIRIVDDGARNCRGMASPWANSRSRGPWVTSGYYNDARGAECFTDGWFRTGDVATIDPEGYIQIMDRTKDLVKSGGEWISSVDLENAIMAHPKVAEAAVVGVFHPNGRNVRWHAWCPRRHETGSPRRRSSTSSPPASPGGGCRTTSSSSRRVPEDQRRQVQQAGAAGTVQGLHSAHGEDLRSRRVADASEPVS